MIVDVSCDAGMGFSWAKPTSFTDPTFTVGDGIHYYAVDHSPSLLWNSATWEISVALLPHLRTALGGPASWEADETVRRAVEAARRRRKEPPHPVLPAAGRSLPARADVRVIAAQHA